MPLELLDAPARLSLRDSAAYSPQGLADYDARQIDASTQFGRGWESASRSNQAGQLAIESNDAAMRGDGLRAAYLKQLAQDEATRAQMWAPTTQNFTDINGVGSALDWAGGALGNLRTSVEPMVGGLAGAGLGAATGVLFKNPALGARVGAALGSSIPAYQMEKGETVSGALLNPNNIATPEQIDQAGTAKGLINAGLEGLVPFGVATSLAGLGKQVAKGEAKKYLGREILKDGATEFATEGSQSLVGQGADNYLKGAPLTNFDYKQAFNEGAAGAMGGFGMGAVGAAGDIAHSQLGRGVDAAKDFAARPTEKIGDMVADAGTKLAERIYNKPSAQEKDLDALAALPDDELRRIFKPGKTSVVDSIRDDEKGLDDVSLDRKRADEARAEAADILNSPARSYSSEVMQAAADVVAGKKDWTHLGTALKEQRHLDESDEMLRAIEGAPKGETKKSLMRPPEGLSEAGKKAWEEKVADNKVGGVDAVNRSKTVSQTPYAGDSFDYNGKPVIKASTHKDAKTGFNYDSIQRSAGIEAAKAADKSTTPQWKRQILDSIENVRNLRNINKKGEADAVKDRQTADIADVLVNGGYAFGDSKVIQAAKTAAQKTEHVRKLAGLITWARYGFQNQGEVIPATLKVYGKESAALARKAYEAGVQEGIVPRDDAAFKKVEQAFSEQATKDKLDNDLFTHVVKNLRPSVQGMAKPEHVGALIGELRRIVKNGTAGENITKGGNTKGRQGDLFQTRSVSDRKVLEALFGDEQHIADALAPLIEQHVAENANNTEASVDVSEMEDTLQDEAVKQKFVDHFKGDSDYFDLKNAADRAAFEKTKKAQESDENKLNGDSTRKEGAPLGIIAHALEKAAAEKGSELTEATRNKIVRKMVKELDSAARELVAPVSSKHMSDFARRDYEKRLADYNRQIEAARKRVDARYVALRVTHTEAEKMALEFGPADIEGLKLKRDLRTTSNAQGTLVFQRVKANGKPVVEPFVTSAPMLLRQMFKNQKREAYVHTHSRGSAYTMNDLLLDAITSLATADGFSGKFGYVKDGEPVWLSGHQDLPANLLVLGGNEKTRKAARFYGEVRDSSVSDRMIGDIKEFETEDGNLVERDVDTPQGKAIELAKLADRAIDSAGKPEAFKGMSEEAVSAELSRLKSLNFSFWSLIKQRVTDLPAGETMIKQLRGQFTTLLQKGASVEEKLAASAEIEKLTKAKLIDLPQGKAKFEALLKQIDEAFEKYFPEGKSYSEQQGQNWKPEEGQVGNDSIRDSDPKGELGGRDNRGMIDSDNTEMVASALTGTSKPLVKGAEDKGPLATKSVKASTEFVIPTDDDLHNAVADNLKSANSDIQPRKLTVEERRMVRSAWTELVRRGLGKQLDGIGHVLAFTVSKHNALMLGEGWKGSKSAIGLNAKLFSELKANLFNNLGEQMRYILAHEVGHNIDIGGDKTNPGAHSTHVGFEMGADGAVGELAKEMQAAALSDNHKFSALLRHTPFKAEYDGRPQAAQRELFAQAFAMYTERKSEMREHLPLTYKHMEALNGRSYSVQQGTGVDGRGLEATQAGRASASQRTDAGRSGQAGVQTGQRAVGAESTAAKRAKLLGQLKAVKPANAIHKKAIDNLIALLEGKKEGDIVKAMRDMLRWDQTLSDLSVRQRETLKTWVEQRGAANEEQVPIEAYDDELGYNSEQADFDREMFEGEADTKKSNQNAEKASGTKAEQTAQDEIKDFLHKVVGDKVKVEFVDAFGDNSSGEWTADDTGNVIRIALNGNVLGTGFHESIHELFNMLRKQGGEKIIRQLEQAAMSPMMQKRLERMLDGHPEAIAQLKTPEEAVAFMFQFWMLDPSGFQIGPQTKTFFEKVKDFLAKILGVFSETVRNDLIKRTAADREATMTDALLGMFAGGALGSEDSRQAVIDKLNSSVEKHEAAMRHLGNGITRLWDVHESMLGRAVMTAEGVIDATNNPYWKGLSRDFHQKAGTEMRPGARGGRGGFSEAVRQEENSRMVKVERMLQGAEKEDLELARKHLSAGTKPDAREARRIYDGIRTYLDDFQNYIQERKISRLERNEASGEYEWVPVSFRKDYWPQVFNVEAVMKDSEKFKQDMLDNHRAILEGIAKEANAAVKNKKGDGPASKAALQAASQQNITAEMIAEEILSRVVSRNQLIDINESESQLGITPAAAAVNRRTLDWLDMDVFDKYMDKDVVNILSSYTASMVKRGEAQVRFGNGGERIQSEMDNGLLYEMGGNDLVDKAEKSLEPAIKAWKERAAAYYEDNKNNPERPPYSQVEALPTLRSVGTTIHRNEVGAEQYLTDLRAAAKKAEGVEKAVMGMEGTLGRDITPNQRALVSWITTYQTFRTLSMSLFQSYGDIMGVVREGGGLADAWDSFVMGMREVRNSWKKELSDDPRFLRAEDWGAIDVGSSMESYGQMQNSVFMTGKAKQLSDWFFRMNGMEGWNRGTRAIAANVAERIIVKWAKYGLKEGDKAELARFERLFGKGAQTSQIKLDADGRLDVNDLDNRAAVNRWVLDAIVTPNGAIKALYANDPHYTTFYHLKNFSYAQHRVALKGALEQAKLGNYRPAAVLATGYIPIIIAANMVKEMLIPGDEPPWMKSGPSGWLSYGWDRAGLLGVQQMYAQNLFDPSAAFGPTVGQLQDILSIPVPEIKVDLPGFDPMTLHRDHTLLGEGFGSLPLGNLLRRVSQ